MARWSDEDDNRLASLFRSGALDPEKLDNKSIKKAQSYFPDRTNYNSFAATYKRKCAKWTLNEQLKGGRKGPQSKYNQLDIGNNIEV